MKTTKFRLLAMIVTLAAVITSTSVNAQRRSTSGNTNERRVENTQREKKSNIENKNANRNSSTNSQVTTRSSKSNSGASRNNPAVNREIKVEKSRSASTPENTGNRSGRSSYSNRAEQNRKETIEKPDVRRDYNTRESVKSSSKVNTAPGNSRRSATDAVESSNRRETQSYSSRRENSEYSKRYNLNTSDDRYRPSRDYRGSDKYWSSDFRTDNRTNHKSAERYSYSKHNHWDRNWEYYRWNHNSWRNYYGHYNPYSYKYHKHYYHHHHYGHVIRKFSYRPHVFVHNHVRYYCHDGFFFRYRRGIGYILVDMPFGMAFEYLPSEYERVYINGYLYFRVGNLFFERTNYGFQLVHYPERYYAFDSGYIIGGFRFHDMHY